MKIVSIFADQLFACHYDDEEDNEFNRLMNLWTDISYLQEYAKRNEVTDVYQFIKIISSDAEKIQDFLFDIHENQHLFGYFFEPLQESERNKEKLPYQKGKIKKSQLRLYAIKLENNCFIITGGAIKMSQKMADHPDTTQELVKLKNVRSFLNENGVFDDDSFFELLTEDI